MVTCGSERQSGVYQSVGHVVRPVSSGIAVRAKVARANERQKRRAGAYAQHRRRSRDGRTVYETEQVHLSGASRSGICGEAGREQHSAKLDRQFRWQDHV